MIYIPDTSVIIDGKITELIKNKKLKGTIIIPEFVICELENQANRGRETGFIGLDEIKNIRELAKKNKITISELGRKPTSEEIKLANTGRIDALIRDIAKNEKGELLTSDIVQAKTAEAQGIKVTYFEKIKIKTEHLKKYFDKNTMSVHLKDGMRPKAKKGLPGQFKLVEIGKEILTKEQLEEIAIEILEAQRTSDKSFIEIAKHKVTVIQLGNCRIAITRPPFSEKMEITAVRPIVNVNLDSYKIPKRLKERLDTKSEGIIVAGPPGHGKSTLSQALANYFDEKKMIVKTMEQPRDLQLNPSITQYGPLEGSMEKTADILLLVRPDLTIYDEIRKTSDFKIFADMRLAGVGMIGVIHATRPIDAIHRFLGRTELGLLPQIIDTILFVYEGKISKVYSLKLMIKVPTGMVEQDLARPVIEVTDFETGTLEYEIYTYGEQTIAIAIEGEATSKIQKLAEEQIKKVVGQFSKDIKITIVSDDRVVLNIPDRDIASFIGTKGKNISKIEEKLGIHISVEPIIDTLKRTVSYAITESGGYLNMQITDTLKINEKFADIYKDKEFLFNATIGKKDIIKIKKISEIGQKVLQAFTLKNLRVLV
ncbi:MAG: PINc/VapC family ATPase [DPANN group archaeon]|nr:PINc/VapC family ATPase [DPANN group archaeon]